MCPMIQLSQNPRVGYKTPILQMGKLRSRGSEPRPRWQRWDQSPQYSRSCHWPHGLVGFLLIQVEEPWFDQSPVLSACVQGSHLLIVQLRFVCVCPVFTRSSLWSLSVYESFLAVPGGAQLGILGPSGLLPSHDFQTLGAKAVNDRTEAWWHWPH